ncbi:MAG: hypothetical protein M1150_00105 [Patescibacteria group bacterium]|nr:hypothetical protein [Patescibacteria group bacterium]
MDDLVAQNQTSEVSPPAESIPPQSGIATNAFLEKTIDYEAPAGFSGKKWLLLFIFALIIVTLGFSGTSFLLSQQSFSPDSSADQETQGSQTALAKASNKNDSQRKKDLKEIGTALEKYYKKNKTYPAFSKEGYQWCDATRLKQDLVPDFLSSVPTDPSGKPYFIYLIPDKGYVAATNLEDTTDPDATKEKLIRYDMGEIYGGTYTDIKFNVDSCPAGKEFNFWITNQ